MLVNGYKIEMGADLSGADLRYVNLFGADLYCADLRGANLRGADLRGVDLREADLRGADLMFTDLRGADLFGVNLSGANLMHCRGISAVIFERHLAIRYKDRIQIGCQDHSIEHWFNNFKTIGIKERYSDLQIKRYGDFIASELECMNFTAS